MKESIKIGYWGNGKDNLPMPVENEVDNNEEAIIKLDAILKLGEEVFFKGWSTCRCCGKINGSTEFIIKDNKDTYVIPEGYKHYLQDHNIKPSPLIEQLYENLVLNKKETFMQKLRKKF